MNFASYHPLITFIYFIPVMVVAFMSDHPVFLLATLVCGMIYDGYLHGRKALRNDIIMMVAFAAIMSLINGIFSHNGVTVLFYVNDNRITAEAFIFGAVSALLVCGIIIWFKIFSTIIDQEKFLYLFGRIAPSFAITLSMIFRNIPLLRTRFREIHEAGLSMTGRNENTTFISKIRQLAKEVSILISWSLETSIETSDRMSARGYGLPKRTSFHLFTLRSRDAFLFIEIVAVSAVSIAGGAAGKTSAWYYPAVVLPDLDPLFLLVIIAYIVLLLTPIAIDVYGEYKWKRYISRI